MNLRELLTGNPNWKLLVLGPNDDNGEPAFAVAYPYVAEQRATIGDLEARWGPEYVIEPDGRITPVSYEPRWARSSFGTAMTNMPTAGLVQCGWWRTYSVLRPDDFEQYAGATPAATRGYDGPLPPLVPNTEEPTPFADLLARERAMHGYAGDELSNEASPELATLQRIESLLTDLPQRIAEAMRASG